MKKAFTLIELLVVIAIVGLIGAVMLPAIGKVRETGKRAQCASNLRQHGIAWYLYFDDHDDYFPIDNLPDVGGATHITFGGKTGEAHAGDGRYGADLRVLNRYLDVKSDDSPSVNVFNCPNDHATANRVSNFDLSGTSYELNIRICVHSPPPRPTFKLSSITIPFNRLLLEADIIDNKPGHGGRGWSPPASTRALVMVLFMDGHAGGPYRFYG